MPESGPAKLTIEAFTDSDFSKPAPIPSVVVPINPAKYSRNGSISYTDDKAAGTAGSSPVFDRMKQEMVTFELVFDATGVVPASVGVTLERGVDDQIDTLKMVAYDYNGEIHRPHYLKLAWGTLMFRCVLRTLDLTYSLFAPSGVPLRARATAAFQSYTNEYLLQARMKKSSPDLSHVRTVQAGHDRSRTLKIDHPIGRVCRRFDIKRGNRTLVARHLDSFFHRLGAALAQKPDRSHTELR